MKPTILFPPKSVIKTSMCFLYPAYHFADGITQNKKFILNVPKHSVGSYLCNNFFNCLNVQGDFEINFQEKVEMDIIEVSKELIKTAWWWAGGGYYIHDIKPSYSGFFDPFIYNFKNPTRINHSPSYGTSLDNIKATSLVFNMNGNACSFHYKTLDQTTYQFAPVNTGYLKSIKILNAKSSEVAIWSNDLEELELSGDVNLITLKTPNLKKLIINGSLKMNWASFWYLVDDLWFKNLEIVKIKSFARASIPDVTDPFTHLNMKFNDNTLIVIEDAQNVQTVLSRMQLLKAANADPTLPTLSLPSLLPCHLLFQAYDVPIEFKPEHKIGNGLKFTVKEYRKFLIAGARKTIMNVAAEEHALINEYRAKGIEPKYSPYVKAMTPQQKMEILKKKKEEF